MDSNEMNYWRVMCQTRHHPGQWQSWFDEQCCAVGWPPSTWRGGRIDGWSFDSGVPCSDASWVVARNALHAMKPGDRVVAMLPDARVGRIGEIVRLEAADEHWNPIVRPSAKLPFGENGRRILVRWKLALGPRDSNVVTRLPRGLRDNGQAAISRLSENRFSEMCVAVADSDNWEPLHGAFAVEKALSDYIAMHPHRLEDGMITHPAAPKVREWAIAPECRIDVVLQDHAGRSVLVECKQHGAHSEHIDQVCRYMHELRIRYPEWGEPRGVVVHGGSRQVSAELRELARSQGVMFVHHELRVDFSGVA